MKGRLRKAGGMRGRAALAAGRARGFTLIELMVVVSIIGILMVAMGFQFQGWRDRYRVEGEIRKLYFDLMEARGRALQRQRAQFLVVNSTTLFTLYEDTIGNGSYDAGAETFITNATIGYALSLNTGAFGSPPFTVTIGKSGRFENIGTMMIAIAHDDAFEEPDRDYDCIELQTTRLNIGEAGLVVTLVDGKDFYQWDAAKTCVAK